MSGRATGAGEPVVIGGVGGSGTRVVAHLVRELGIWLGGDLNEALDNLWFHLLFRRPEWYRAKPAQVPIALRIFEKAMRGGLRLEPAERAILREALREHRGRRFALARSMRQARGPGADCRGWGWKNPSAHIFVEQLADAFPGMRYVHVIRNGLELADAEKTGRQVAAWGPLFGIDPPGDGAAPAPQAALRYWIRANRRALRLGPALFGDRFLRLGYESVCRDPAGALTSVAEFLEIRPTQTLAEAFSAFVSPPPSRRDTTREAERFDPRDLAEARALAGADRCFT